MPRLVLQLLTVVSLLMCAVAFDHAGMRGSHHPAPDTVSTAAVPVTAPVELAAAVGSLDGATHTHAGQHDHHSGHACEQPAAVPQPAWAAAELAPVTVLPVPDHGDRPARDDKCRPAPPSLLLVTCVCRR